MAGQSRIEARRRRRAPRTFRLRKPKWIDPYPGIPGTEPEKRLFEALMRRHIYFIFQGDLKEFKEKDFLTLSPPGYKPDFILPEYRVILDPYGLYHHTLPEALIRDFWKGVLYRAAGYSFYHPWWGNHGWEWVDSYGASASRVVRRVTAQRFIRARDVERAQHKKASTDLLKPLGYDTNAVLDRIPELKHGIRFPLKDKEDIDAKRTQGYRLGKNLGAGANSVALANAKRKRPKAITLRTRGRRKRRPTR